MSCVFLMFFFHASRLPVPELWATNQDQRRQINNLQRKLHELTSAFERHKSEADSHRHELSTLKTRLLVDQMHHYLCIDA